MANEVWYDHFMGALFGKYPKKTQLAKALMDLLCLEREAAYRRLRGDVHFTASEIVKISSAWNISLDEITGVSAGKIPFLLQPINYIAPTEQELNLLQHIVQSIYGITDYPDTEFMDICNKLPRQLLAGFGSLNRFYLFKWQYQYGSEKKPLPFSQVAISEDMRRLTADYYSAIKHVPVTNFIFDRKIFEDLVDEIRYFYHIQMITEDEIVALTNDLYSLLDYLSEVAANGCYPETQNKVNMFISNLKINTNYSYTSTNRTSTCFVHVFDKYEIFTHNSEMLENFKAWMHQKKRSSIQISEIDAKSRIDFFNRQRELVATSLFKKENH